MGRASQAASPHILPSSFTNSSSTRSPAYGRRPTVQTVLFTVQYRAQRSTSSNRFQEVLRLIASLPCKQCRTDPLPTWLLMECSVELAPYICQMCNASLRSGHVPESFKIAHITPLLKKANLDSSDVKNYRPISNLSVVSKLLERIILRRLLEHLKRNDMLPSVQSAYRKCHSTESATARVFSDILTALDRGDVAALALLDLSAAFDTVDHSILLRRLRESYNISGAALTWISSYVPGRRQCVVHSGSQSSYDSILFGVPQCSVLGRCCSYCTQPISCH